MSFEIEYMEEFLPLPETVAPGTFWVVRPNAKCHSDVICVISNQGTAVALNGAFTLDCHGIDDYSFKPFFGTITVTP